MPTETFAIAVSADDGVINKYDDVAPFDWPPIAVTEDWAVWVALTFASARKSNTGAATELPNAYMRFDTSTLPDTAVISSAVLKLTMSDVNNVDTRNLNVEWYTPGSWPPSAAADYVENVGTTAGAFALSSLTAFALNSLTLSSPTTVNRTGYSSLRLGISGGVPTGQNRAQWFTFDHATEQEPRLEVTYTTADPPNLRVVQSNLRW